MDQQALNVLRIRRLIRNGRYYEARALLRETRHSAVPYIDQQINALIAAASPPAPRHRIITRVSLLAALASGLIFGLMAATGGIYSLYGIGVMTLLGAVFGLILPEVLRKRQNTYDYLVGLYFENRNRRYRGR